MQKCDLWDGNFFDFDRYCVYLYLALMLAGRKELEVVRNAARSQSLSLSFVSGLLRAARRIRIGGWGEVAIPRNGMLRLPTDLRAVGILVIEECR